MKNCLVLKRVSYGKDTTPLEDREYHEGLGTPVGNVSELKEFYKGRYDELMLMDKELKDVEQNIKIS